eukprot:TRINITY_DN262_c0_g3_i2.p1 TRINITY_DN262_c0_g3~~TRINITY_DN262_c0_g3_i2.p1  ORF type:complete len:331 (-),score=120.18 TRINITY_DN262_c0_g3_i2:158-1150(-)
MAFWGLEVTPGKSVEVPLDRALHLSMATFGAQSKSGRSVVYVTVEGNKYALCVLESGKTETMHLDHVITPDQELSILVEGPNPVTLTGYLSQEDFDGEDDDDEEGIFDDEDDEDDEEDGEDEDDDEDDDEEDEEEEEEEEKKQKAPEPAAAPKDAKNKAAEESKKRPATAPEESAKKPKQEQPKQEQPKQQAAAPKTPEKAQQQKKQQPQTPTEKPKTPSSPGLVSLKGGLQYQDKTVGKGAVAQAGKKVTIRYVGTLAKNGHQFDAGKLGFRLGTGEVIKGFDMGVQDMKEGGRRVITIPAHLGYGNRKTGDIPANSTLVFDVELVKVN